MKILIADDETPIREWIQFSIERAHDLEFEVVGTAENGKEALEMALLHQVDTVITDICMPGMDGLMLMKTLQKELPWVSFIILTNYAEFSYAREAISYGAKKYMLKSEMRGKDILDALEEIRKNMEKQLDRKDMDCDSNGYLDIYSCVYHADDMEYMRAFWKRHQFNESMKFRVAALRRRDILKQKDMIHDFGKAEACSVIRPIQYQDYIFVIIQGDDLEKVSHTTEAFEKLCKMENQGILTASRVEMGTEQVLECIEEAENLQQYRFFFEAGCFTTEDSEKWIHLNREKIKKDFKRILVSILHEDREVVLAGLEQWFSDFSKEPFHRKDLHWARELCVNLMIQMEEIVSENFLNYQEEHEPKRVEDVWQCGRFCRKLVEMLYSGDNVSYSQSVRDTIKYIHQNYNNQELSLKEAAKAIYRSPEYLSRLFKAETGKNFTNYLMEYRLEKAKNLLLFTNMKVYEIAYAVGYTNPSYFSKVYHEYTGMTPEMMKSQKSNRMS